MKKVNVYLESGDRYVFAGALDWRGWCRRGRSEEQAVQALLDYGPRYAAVLENSGLAFQAPGSLSDLEIQERLAGSATTDFGAPDAIPALDQAALDAAGEQRSAVIFKACWAAFDRALEAAAGKELRKGPRGGGRDQEKIRQHLLDSDLSYLRAVGYKHHTDQSHDLAQQLQQTRQSMLAALGTAVAGQLPREGPRGGKIWPVRYFVRRAAWHTLDHAWEIEDRTAD